MENLDPELQAMASISSALGELETESQARVLRWAADKFGVTVSSKNAAANANGDDKDQSQSSDFVDFVDLLDKVNPSGNLEKALTGAYWVQVVQGASSWQSQQVNNVLKDTGNGITSIVDAFDSAQSKTPALVRQMAKSGKSRQARKTFKLTSAGIKFIASKISGDIDTSGEE
jgi:hypothetical protein